MWLSYLSTNNFMFSIWSKTNLKNQNTAELSVLAEWSKTPISQIQSLMFECFIRSFHFYISKFKEKACNRLKCFIQPELMLFCFSYYSSQCIQLFITDKTANYTKLHFTSQLYHNRQCLIQLGVMPIHWRFMMPGFRKILFLGGWVVGWVR